MAKACPVKICIAKDNISHQVLLESLQNLHIEAVRDILTSKDLTSSQLCHLSMEMQEKTKQEISGYNQRTA